MSLRTEHVEKGWREVESGEFGKWAAEKFYSSPGASSTVLRVEAASNRLLNDAVALRQAQLGDDGAPVADVTLPGGQVVTTAEHSGLAIAGTLPVVQENPSSADLEADTLAAEGVAEAVVEDPTPTGEDESTTSSPETTEEQPSGSGSTPTSDTQPEDSPESPLSDSPETESVEEPETPATV